MKLSNKLKRATKLCVTRHAAAAALQRRSSPTRPRSIGPGDTADARDAATASGARHSRRSLGSNPRAPARKLLPARSSGRDDRGSRTGLPAAAHSRYDPAARCTSAAPRPSLRRPAAASHRPAQPSAAVAAIESSGAAFRYASRLLASHGTLRPALHGCSLSPAPCGHTN